MRRDQQRLHDILEALDWVAKAIARQTEADFVADALLCHCPKADGYRRSGLTSQPGNYVATQLSALE